MDDHWLIASAPFIAIITIRLTRSIIIGKSAAHRGGRFGADTFVIVIWLPVNKTGQPFMCVPNLRKHYDNADLYVFIIFLLDEYYN